MEESFEDLDVQIILRSSRMNLETLSKIQVILTSVLLKDHPEVSLVERKRTVLEIPQKILYTIDSKFQA